MQNNGVVGKVKKNGGDEKKTIQAVVEATTQKYGGGVKLDGVFYNLAEGLELPEKGDEIVAIIQGRNIIKWWKVEEEVEQDGGEEHEGPDKQGVKTFGLSDDIKIPENVKTITDTFLAILKYLDERAQNMWSKDKIIVASVVFKEIMETRRAKLQHRMKNGEN